MPMSREMADEAMQWANDNYESSGHWIYETSTIESLMEDFDSVEKVKEHCSTVQDHYDDIRGNGGCNEEEAARSESCE